MTQDELFRLLLADTAIRNATNLLEQHFSGQQPLEQPEVDKLFEQFAFAHGEFQAVTNQTKGGEA